jgi:hypothetical protein
MPGSKPHLVHERPRVLGEDPGVDQRFCDISMPEPLFQDRDGHLLQEAVDCEGMSLMPSSA